MLPDVGDDAGDGERSFAGRHPESTADDRLVRANSTAKRSLTTTVSPFGYLR
jgi:hypothetical protein